MRLALRIIALSCVVLVAGMSAAQEEKPPKPRTFYFEVLDEKGQPAAGVEVLCAEGSYTAAFSHEEKPQVERVKTGDDGVGVLKGMTGRDYCAYAVRGDTYALTNFYPGLGSEDTATVRLKLLPGRRALGFVHTPEGVPLEGVQVLYQRGLVLAESDARGCFTAPEEKGDLSLYKPGYGVLEVWELEGDFEVVMLPETVVDITVVHEDGTPIPGAKVRYRGDRVTADANGNFRSIGLTAGDSVNFDINYEALGKRWASPAPLAIGPAPTQRATLRLKQSDLPPQAHRMPVTENDVMFASLASRVGVPAKADVGFAVAQGEPVQEPTPKAPREGKYRVKGVVVDEEGKPMDSAEINFSHAVKGSSSSGWFHLDARGGFDGFLKLDGAWTVRRVWRVGYLQVAAGKAKQIIGEFAVVDGGEFTVPESGETKPLRIVVKTPHPQGDLICGVVQDEDGKPVTAGITAFSPDWEPKFATTGNGWFTVTPSLNTPGILLFRAQGYKPRVMDMGRTLNAGQHDVKVVLEKGPFTAVESVWTAVTGRPDTEAATAEQYSGKFIRDNIEHFRAIAEPVAP